MNEIIELKDGSAIVDNENTTTFYNTEGDEIYKLKFRLNYKVILQAILDARQAGYSQGYLHGTRAGRAEMVATIHELLGIDKLVAVLEYVKRGY